MKIQDQYKHYCEAVIREHSEVFSKTDLTDIEKLMAAIVKANRVFVMGAGREGISLRGFAMRLEHLGKETHWVWDDTTPAMGEGDVFILSDGRADIGMFRYILETAKSTGVTIAMFTGCPDGPSAGKFADIVIFVPAKVYLADNPRAVQTVQLMGALYEQHLYLLCDIIVLLLRNSMGLSDQDLEKRHRNIE